MSNSDNALKAYIQAVSDGGGHPTDAQWERIVALAAEGTVPLTVRRKLDARSSEEWAAWVKEELAKPGRSQAELSRRVGVHQSTINRLVNGKVRLRADDMARVEQYLAETAQ